MLNTNDSIAEVAIRFKVNRLWQGPVRASACLVRMGRVQHNHVPLKRSGLEAVLVARVQASNELTLEQWRQSLQAEHGIEVSVTTLWKTLSRVGLCLKKRRSMLPSRNART